MTSRSCVKILGFGSFDGVKRLDSGELCQPKGVWTLSTLKSSLSSLITAISSLSFALHLFIACEDSSDMTPLRKRTFCRAAAT
ncbi:hypothetical protein SAMN04487912_11498 [Arthrobacter sp. cf158]|nr:hypothetical protein SAMN04487912_11498 [Arthrobacter sp. cf158]